MKLIILVFAMIYGWWGPLFAQSTPQAFESTKDLNRNAFPSENFSLLDWKLTLPTSKDIKEKQLANGYQSSAFFTDPKTGGLVFRVSAQAASTSNTKYARSELREMLRSGNSSISTRGINKNNWVIDTASSEKQKNAGGVNGVLTGTCRVDEVTASGSSSQVGRVIIGQIHGADDEPCRLYYRKLPGNELGSIYFGSERWQGSDQWFEMIGSRSDNAPNPIDGIALGEVFTYRIELTGRQLTVSIFRKGKATVKATHTIDDEYDNDWFYFRAGAYIQDNTAPADEHAQVTFFALENSHD